MSQRAKDWMGWLTVIGMLWAFGAFVLYGIALDDYTSTTTENVHRCLGLHDSRDFRLCVFRSVQ